MDVEAGRMQYAPIEILILHLLSPEILSFTQARHAGHHYKSAEGETQLPRHHSRPPSSPMNKPLRGARAIPAMEHVPRGNCSCLCPEQRPLRTFGYELGIRENHPRRESLQWTLSRQRFGASGNRQLGCSGRAVIGPKV